MRALWGDLIDQLRIDYPGVSVTSLPHGRATVELRTLFEAGALEDVTSMTSTPSTRGTGIFTDYKGHADRILVDLGTLVWVGSLYDVDLTDFPLPVEYKADLIDIAQTIISEDNQIR